MRKFVICLVTVFISVSLLCSCGTKFQKSGQSSATAAPDPAASTAPGEYQTDIDAEDLSFSNKDKKTEYDTESATVIELTDDVSEYRITAAGDYVISGSCASGSIIIEAGDEDKIHIILTGVSVTSTNAPCFNLINADKVFVTLEEGSENYFTMEGESESDGAVFAKDDLAFNGSGSLTVVSSLNGIVGKDDLIFTGGTFNITASGHGLQGKDCVKVQDGTFVINSKNDGIHSGNDTDTAGFIFIEGGVFNIEASGDGIDAAGECIIAGGDFTIKTGSGASSSSSSGRGYSSYGRNMTSTSTKGIKSAVKISCSDGVINVNSCDDALHSDGNLCISGGTLTIAASDDAIHAGDATSITGGNITITQSYEGIEGHQIYVSGGYISLVASDDGFNAAGDTTSSQGGFGGMGGGMGSDSEAVLSISGGYIHVNASGDGVDSNGDLTVSGGEIYVSGPTNSSNGALDYGGDAVITGGIVIACGASGMDESFGTSSTQGVIRLRTSVAYSAGKVVSIKDSDGNVLASFTPDKNYNSIVISHPDIVKGETYTVTTGTVDNTINMTSLNYGSSGSSMGGGGGMGGGMGGGGHGGRGGW